MLQSVASAASNFASTQLPSLMSRFPTSLPASTSLYGGVAGIGALALGGAALARNAKMWQHIKGQSDARAPHEKAETDTQAPTVAAHSVLVPSTDMDTATLK